MRGGESLPDFVTHYTRGEPFRSLTSAAPDAWPEIIASLSERSYWGVARLADPHYLPRRLAVERELLERFVAAGGEPRIQHPIYCVMGRSDRMECEPGIRAYQVSLRDIPSEGISFTFGDSLICGDPEYRAEAHAKGEFRSSLCGRLFRLGQLASIEELVLSEGLVDTRQRPFDQHLEVQLWFHPDSSILRVRGPG